MTAKKKTFADDLKNNPALSFIGSAKEKTKAILPDEVPDEATLKRYAEALGLHIKPEPKKRRVQLVLQESLYTAAKEKIAEIIDPETKKPLSFNEYVSELIRQDIYSNTQE